MLGGKVMVPLLDGAMLVEFSSMAKKVRIAGQGWPKRPGSTKRRDLIVILEPEEFRPSTAQRKILEQIDRVERNNCLPSWDWDVEMWAQGSTESRYRELDPMKPKMRPTKKATSATS
jgi:hypothetical protein